MDRSKNPIILLSRNKILLQTFQRDYRSAYNLLVQIAEPISRPVYIHQFQLNIESLIKAMTLGYDFHKIYQELSRYMQNEFFPPQMLDYIQENTQRFGVAKMQLIDVQNEDGKRLYHVLQIQEDIYRMIGGLEGVQYEVKNESCPNKKRLFLEEDYTLTTKKLHENKIPCIFQHKFITHQPDEDDDNPRSKTQFEIQLKPFAQLRYYQQDSLKSIFEGGRAKSGIIVLPCGAGKTLLGIAIACRLKKSTLVVCNGDASVQQWKNQFIKWTTRLDHRRIIKLTGKSHSVQSLKKREQPLIVITSYPYLNSKLNKDRPGQEQHRIKKMLWGLCILDEVQCLPANQYKQIIHKFKANVKIGLTATPYREDQRFDSLNYLIGPTLYQANWLDFIEEGHLANPYCVQVRIPYSESISMLPGIQKDHRKKLLMENPLKFKVLMYLLKVHQDRGDFVIVFCDYVPLIQYYARAFKRPVVCGQTPEQDRRFIFDMFRRGVFRTVFLCRVGDEGIDLPNASVGIELTMFGRSRKQAVQRLGRIMRPKQSTGKGYNSFFYTFVSCIQEEMQYFYKRQKCLADLGFPHGIIKQEQLPYNFPQMPESRMFKEKELKEINEFREWLREEQRKIMQNSKR